MSKTALNLFVVFKSKLKN